MRIHDERGQPVAGAAVRLEITLPSGAVRRETVTTGEQGQAGLSFLTSHTGTYTFTVTGVRQPGYAYAPELNTVTSASVTVP